MPATMTATTVMSTAMATAVAVVVASTAITRVIAVARAATAMAGDGLFLTAHEGDADDCEEHRNPEYNNTIHP